MKNIVLIFVFLTFIVGGIFAQEAPKSEPKPEEAQKVEEKPEPPIKEVVLIINTEQVNNILVVSVDGRWVHDARTISVETTVASNKKPTVKCTLYKGLFKPTNPETKTWDLTNIVMASKEEFQEILDGLQQGKFQLQ